jgi:hypothetical protein
MHRPLSQWRCTASRRSTSQTRRSGKLAEVRWASRASPHHTHTRTECTDRHCESSTPTPDRRLAPLPTHPMYGRRVKTARVRAHRRERELEGDCGAMCADSARDGHRCAWREPHSARRAEGGSERRTGGWGDARARGDSWCGRGTCPRSVHWREHIHRTERRRGRRWCGCSCRRGGSGRVGAQTAARACARMFAVQDRLADVDDAEP